MDGLQCGGGRCPEHALLDHVHEQAGRSQTKRLAVGGARA
jgi:hypothetical protein